MLKNNLKKQKSLTLNRETVLVLAQTDLAFVAGGFGATAHCVTTSKKLSDCGCATQ